MHSIRVLLPILGLLYLAGWWSCTSRQTRSSNETENVPACGRPVETETERADSSLFFHLCERRSADTVAVEMGFAAETDLEEISGLVRERGTEEKRGSYTWRIPPDSVGVYAPQRVPQAVHVFSVDTAIGVARLSHYEIYEGLIEKGVAAVYALPNPLEDTAENLYCASPLLYERYRAQMEVVATGSVQPIASRVLDKVGCPAGPTAVVHRTWVIRGDTGSAGAVSCQRDGDRVMGAEHFAPGAPTRKHLFVIESTDSLVTHTLADTSPYLIFEMAVAPLLVHDSPLLVMSCGYPATDHIFARVFYFSQGVACEVPLGYIPDAAIPLPVCTGPGA